MSNLFKPRRGSKSTMTGPKSNTILQAGEMFFEIPDDGLNSSTTGRIMLGDGTSTYGSLNPFMEGVQTAAVTVSADSSTTSTAALNNVASNKTTGKLIGSLKKAISLTKSELNTTVGSLNNLSTVDKSNIVSAINEVSNNVGGTLYFSSQACSALTGNFCTISNANITANHVVAEAVFANPSAITADVTWTTANGSLTLNGTCTSATTVNIVMVKKNN